MVAGIEVARRLRIYPLTTSFPLQDIELELSDQIAFVVDITFRQSNDVYGHPDAIVGNLEVVTAPRNFFSEALFRSINRFQRSRPGGSRPRSRN
jgi:hypothetical protein